ncbi:hypothetical protein CSUI_008875 [Cystoisospora suis]|uniref:Uncharacterized protein n=1 Tax=Cystoisospora suis TaxID=483139 RepID=A0A2C6KLP0_9APIC|nr:hypothetical protein CSUI_008875 [Cystoisospora suis]
MLLPSHGTRVEPKRLRRVLCSLFVPGFCRRRWCMTCCASTSRKPKSLFLLSRSA